VVVVAAGYDHPSGAYLSASGIGSFTDHDGFRGLGYQAYAGYAWRRPTGVAWDVGLSHYDVTQYVTPHYRTQFSEAYAGVTKGPVSLHVYYSPNYLGEHVRTVYATGAVGRQLSQNWRLFGHIGVLAPLNPDASAEISKPQYDGAVGVARKWAKGEIQASWTGLAPSFEYPTANIQRRSALVLGGSFNF
jgi:hypothetical protein